MTPRTNLAARGKARNGPSKDGGIEERLFTLQATAPELITSLPTVFRKAVLESVKSNVEPHQSRAVLAALREVDLGYRLAVFNALDSFFGRKARALETAIDQRFSSKVSELVGSAGAFRYN